MGWQEVGSLFGTDKPTVVHRSSSFSVKNPQKRQEKKKEHLKLDRTGLWANKQNKEIVSKTYKEYLVCTVNKDITWQ